MRLSAIAAPDQKLVRTILWDSGTHRNVRLAVTIEYVPPATLKEQHEQERVKIITKRKLTPMEDVAEINNLLERVYYLLLAGAIKKITLPGGEPATLREMWSLFSLDASQVKAMGGLGAPVELDLADQTPLSDEERKGFEKQGPKTKGDLAKENVLFLIRNRTDFRQFIETVVADISYFQDSEWEDQLKNS